MKAFVLYSKDEHYGVFLGEFWGLGFWSNCDPVGQTHACTFESPEQGEEFIASWIGGPPPTYQFVEVNADENGGASIEACIKAGLPAWNSDI